MRCEYCGEEIDEGALFCSYCGHRVIVKKKRFCPSCGQEVNENARFCPMCGSALNGQQPTPKPAPQPEPKPQPQPKPQPEPKPQPQPAPQPKPVPKGALISDLGLMSLYDGEPKVAAVSKASGSLKIYDDRIEMKKALGSGMGGLISAAKARKDPVVAWYYQDMLRVRVGRYGGIYHTIVIEMKNGTKYSFASSSPAPNKIDNAVSLIAAQLRNV